MYTNWLQELFGALVFPIGVWDAGTSWISRKGGILEKRGIDLEKVGGEGRGGVRPPLPTMFEQSVLTL